MKVESINEALCLIIGKADQGMYGEADAKTMCYEILEVAKQVYNKSPESPVEAAEGLKEKEIERLKELLYKVVTMTHSECHPEYKKEVWNQFCKQNNIEP